MTFMYCVGSCIVDESMLTGKSLPQKRESLETTDEMNRKLDLESYGKLFVLFGGAKIVQHSAPSKLALRAPDDRWHYSIHSNRIQYVTGKTTANNFVQRKRVI